MLTITDSEFRKLTDYIRVNYGIYLKEEKRSLVLGRLNNLLAQKDFKSFSEYYDYIIADKTGSAASDLMDRITTNHTYFMREAGHFHYFRDEILPYLMKTVEDRDLRIWSAGCSTGEEPYTLAMIIKDHIGEKKNLWDTKVLATDISRKALQKALKGIYKNEALSTLPYQWKLNYFKILDREQSIITDSIKQEVIFRRFNLMERSFPFRRKFHIIFCRNVMIYFNAETKERLIRKFYQHTEPGGYLFLGHSESLNRREFGYRYVMPAVYRKE